MIQSTTNHKFCRLGVWPHRFNRFLILVGIPVVLAGCLETQLGRPPLNVALESKPLRVDNRPCTGSFVPRYLSHDTLATSGLYGYVKSITRGMSGRIGFYLSNGAGVALADLDNDGLIDIVLPGLHAPTSIYWNLGSMKFKYESLDAKFARAVNAVDVDGDDRLDLVFTHVAGSPSLWRATAGASRPVFTRVSGDEFRGAFYLYAMAWADLDDDGDLDMVGASYDVERRRQLTSYNPHLTDPGTGGGVFLFTNDGGVLTPMRLSEKATALALLLTDLNDDDQRDILIGNDFQPADEIFFNTAEGWITAAPFATTTTNTMSFAEGDIDNDGIAELLATDMKPYRLDEATENAWAQMAENEESLKPEDGVQVVANVLQTLDQRGSGFIDRAEQAGVDATGWSWSAQFGDLDNDGFLDLYVVNGMIALELFDHLPGDELVEENQALRNDGTGRFVPAPQWGLGATESGRGMSFADLDNDGDLDVVVNNLAKRSLIFENRLCGGGALEVKLHWEGSPNRRAIGAELRLGTVKGVMHREMRASSGYLSSDPARVHFGLGKMTNEDLHQLEITWPDGQVSRIRGLYPGALYIIKRSI